MGAWRESELLFDCGVTDFAGSGVVHLCGAVAALVGAKVVGPRIGRFDEGIKLPQQSVVFQTLGTLILWMGWYGFNGASTLAIGTSTGDLSGAAAHTLVTTTLSAASCCLTTVAITALMSKDKVIDIGAANNGILAGLVSITAGCSSVECYAAILIGIIGAFWYVAGCAFLEKLKIDDVVGAVPVHGFCGIWGVLAPGLFASELQYSAAYYSARAAKCAGIFEGGDGSMLAANVVFIIAVILWVGITSTLLFLGGRGERHGRLQARRKGLQCYSCSYPGGLRGYSPCHSHNFGTVLIYPVVWVLRIHNFVTFDCF